MGTSSSTLAHHLDNIANRTSSYFKHSGRLCRCTGGTGHTRLAFLRKLLILKEQLVYLYSVFCLFMRPFQHAQYHMVSWVLLNQRAFSRVQSFSRVQFPQCALHRVAPLLPLRDAHLLTSKSAICYEVVSKRYVLSSSLDCFYIKST